MEMQKECSAKVQGAFYNAFYRWGYFVGTKPWRVVLVSFFLALAGSARLILAVRNPLPSVVEQEQLWVPQQAQAVTDKGKYDKIFTNTFRRNTVYFTTKPPGGDVLTSSVLKEVRRFDLMVTSQLNATALGAGTAGTELHDAKGKVSVDYNDVCAQSSVPLGRNLSDPDDEGGIPCILFGHPLEAFYRVGGVNDGEPRDPLWLPGDFVFDYTDQEIRDILTAKKGVDKTLFPESSNRTINVEASFGGISRDPTTNAVLGAKAVAMTYLLAEHPEGADRNKAIAWEDQLNFLIDSAWTDAGLSEGSASGTYSTVGRTATANNDPKIKWESTLIDIFPSTSGATSRELGKNIRGDLGALNAAFMIILVYACFIFGRCQPTRSRVLLALSGCVSVGMSIAFAFGFTTLIGFKLNPVINVLPFVLIGIGVDDMFVLITSLEAENDLSVPVPERVAKAMAKAGVSITITSLTDIMAFLLGASSQLPALSTFCVFAAIGIAADYLLQISFFSAFMALDAYREVKSKVDCCPCCCPPVPEKKASSGCCCFGCCWGQFDCLRPLGLRAFLVKYYIPLLRIKAVKALVVVGFLGYAGFSAWAASNLKQDFQFRWFVNDDAKLQATFDIQDQYFSSTGLPVNVVTPPSSEYDYTSIANQKKLVTLAAGIDPGMGPGNKYIEKDSMSFWYPSFREWLHECGKTETYGATEMGSGQTAGFTCVKRDCTYGTMLLFPYCTRAKELRDAGGNNLKDAYDRDIPGASDRKYLVDASGAEVADGFPLADSYIPPAKFMLWLDQFLVDAPLGAIQASEVIWTNNKTVRDCGAGDCTLSATRLRANYKATDKADEQVASMRTLRESVTASGIGSSFPYMFMYLYYEQYAIILSEAVFNLSLALVAVFVITFTMIVSLRATFLVMLCVVLVDVDILGLMWLWGLTIDSVAIINLVLAIGLSVDYCVHIAHAFLQTPGTRQERVDHALEEMGTAVTHGVISTFLAVLILSTSKSYIFRIFFKQFFGICLFGGLHGLCFLPTVLSLIGPDYIDYGKQGASSTKGKDYAGNTTPEEKEMSAVPAVPPSPPTEGFSSAPPSAPASENGDSSPRLAAASPMKRSVLGHGGRVAPHVV